MVFAAARDGCQRVWERNNQETGRNDTNHVDDDDDGIIRRLILMMLMGIPKTMLVVVIA